MIFFIVVFGLALSFAAGETEPEFIIFNPEEVIDVSLNSLVTRGKTAGKDYVYYPRLGNFSITAPWVTPKRTAPAPQDPSIVGTKIYFYSRKNCDKPAEILLDPKVDLNGAMFKNESKTYVLVHGFIADGNATYLHDLKDAILQKEDANVLLVDWGKGAKQIDYTQGASNIRIVAREIYLLIKAIISQFKYELAKIHLIGHSLGAQVVGEVGRLFKGLIGIITGLDPAQPLFEGYNDTRLYLDKTDAVFVVQVQTNGKPFILVGFGFQSEIAHLTFVINGGKDQPGCAAGIIDIDDAKKKLEGKRIALSDSTLCPHGRAVKYFVEAVRNKNCTFWGRKHSNQSTDVIRDYISGGEINFDNDKELPPCNITSCAPLGLDAIKSHLRGRVDVRTNSLAPFCLQEDKNPGKISWIRI